MVCNAYIRCALAGFSLRRGSARLVPVCNSHAAPGGELCDSHGDDHRDPDGMGNLLGLRTCRPGPAGRDRGDYDRFRPGHGISGPVVKAQIKRKS